MVRVDGYNTVNLNVLMENCISNFQGPKLEEHTEKFTLNYD